MANPHSPEVAAILKRREAQPKYEVLAKWRNGWTLIKHPTTGQHYLRRMMRGQYPVNVQKDGASWSVRDTLGQRIYPGLLK